MCPQSCTDYGKSINSSGQRLLQSCPSLHMVRCAEWFWLWIFWDVLWHWISAEGGARGLKGRKNKWLRHWALGIESFQLCSCQGALRLIISPVLFLTYFLCLWVSGASLSFLSWCFHLDPCFLRIRSFSPPLACATSLPNSLYLRVSDLRRTQDDPAVLHLDVNLYKNRRHVWNAIFPTLPADQHAL